MLRLTLCFFCFILLAGFDSKAAPAEQQADPNQVWAEIKKLDWHFGPSTEKIGARASIHIPANYVFLSAQDTSRYVVLLGNLPRSESYTVAPKDLNWFSIFDFDPVGYVKDDEKIDSDEILRAMKEHGTEENAERKKRGLELLTLDGWFVPPHYDQQTKRLEWGTRLLSEDKTISVNYTIRILGRTGVMSATLVSDPGSLDKDMSAFKATLNGFSFNSGEGYAEFRSGDKVAEYGLAGLIIGGAAAVAAKSGFLKVIGKFGLYIIFGGAALVAGLAKKLFGTRTKAT